MSRCFVITVLNKSGIEDQSAASRIIYDKPTAEVRLSGEKLKVFPPRPGTKQDVQSYHTVLLQYQTF